ncbi:hypothetical protein JHU04_004348 [Brenneria sp. 4F2]|nr:hypothetical protein [Brenneria bubanii]
MIEAKIVYSQKGDFLLMRSSDDWFISVLIPNFYPNSHLDVSKEFRLTKDALKYKDDIEYMKTLAENIRKDWKAFSDKEVIDITIVK